MLMSQTTRKPQIAIVAGGYSSEYGVSLNSGRNLFQAIDRDLFTPWLVYLDAREWQVMDNDRPLAPVCKSDFSFLLEGEKIRFDFAYITIHGTPGEDGLLQGYLEMVQVPYSTCNVEVSALTFNKWHCNNFLRNFGIPMARTLRLKKGEPVDAGQIVKELGLPLFVKPNAGGSSFGITKVKEVSALEGAVQYAWTESGEALIDTFIAGTEYTCGLLKTGNHHLVFPLTEVVPKNEFFDFEAKYTPGVTDEITPARLPADLAEACRQMSIRIYDLCGCSGIVRIDYILNNGLFYFLDLNTTPGMTATSFIPQQIKAMGNSLTAILTMVIAERLKTHG